MSVYDSPLIFNLYTGAAQVFCKPFGIIPVEKRQRIARVNSKLSFRKLQVQVGQLHGRN